MKLFNFFLILFVCLIGNTVGKGGRGGGSFGSYHGTYSSRSSSTARPTSWSKSYSSRNYYYYNKHYYSIPYWRRGNISYDNDYRKISIEIFSLGGQSNPDRS